MNSEIILEFVKCINEHDTEGLFRLMHVDHSFTDSHNNIITGKEIMKGAWSEYFRMFPDYKIEIDEFYELGDMFVMIGFASGTYRGIDPERNHWRLPSAWRAIVEGGQVLSWQVFCDTKIPYDIMGKSR